MNHSRAPLFLSIGTALALALGASDALAVPEGIPGYSGKPTQFTPNGESCNQCHSGGTAPTVTMAGPATLTSGQVAQYSFTVQTGAAKAGADIAATDEVVLTAVGNLQPSFDELVHVGPTTVSGGSATFTFSLKAPAYGGPIKIWATGLAANGNGSDSGDRASATAKDITVDGPPRPAPPPGSATPSSSSSPSTTTSSTGSSTLPDGGTKAPTAAPLPGEEDDGSVHHHTTSAEMATCSAAAGPPGDTGAYPVSAGILALLMAARRHRRRNF